MSVSPTHNTQTSTKKLLEKFFFNFFFSSSCYLSRYISFVCRLSFFHYLDCRSCLIGVSVFFLPFALKLHCCYFTSNRMSKMVEFHSPFIAIVAIVVTMMANTVYGQYHGYRPNYSPMAFSPYHPGMFLSKLKKKLFFQKFYSCKNVHFLAFYICDCCYSTHKS